MVKKRPLHAVEEERRLDQLVEYPLQPLYNDGLIESRLKALASNIKKNGLLQKIQILPNNQAGLPANTILDGHQRWKALLLNRETTTIVIVRHDLAQADPLIIEQVFLEANVNRQHQDPLLQARSTLRLFEIEKKRPRGQLRQSEEGEARDRVGKALGMSGRNLTRYWRVLRTPVEIQNAFRARKLSLVVAEKVADLEERAQKTIAKRIRAGEVPKKVVAEFLPSRKPRQGTALRHLLSALARGQVELGGRLEHIQGGLFGTAIKELHSGRKLLDALIVRLEHNAKQATKKLKRLSQVRQDEEE